MVIRAAVRRPHRHPVRQNHRNRHRRNIASASIPQRLLQKIDNLFPDNRRTWRKNPKISHQTSIPIDCAKTIWSLAPFLMLQSAQAS